MKKKFFTLLTLFTILYSVNVFADTPYVHNQPTNDTSKKIELSVDAHDVIIPSKDIEFAWIYQKDAESAEQPINVTGSVLDVKNGNYWKKGDINGHSTLTIEYAKYGNGIYKVKARDLMHNETELKKIEINGWDVTKPTSNGLSIDKTGLLKESTVVLEDATDNIVLAAKPYVLSEITDWDGDPSSTSFTKTTSKPATSGNEFVFTKNGDYCITLTDYAGNSTEYPFTVDNIDRAIPVISSVEFKNNDGALNVIVHATDNSSQTPLVNYSHKLKYLIADSPEEIELAQITDWNDTNVLTNRLGGILDTVGITSYYVGVIDEAGNYAIMPFTLNADLVLGKLNNMTTADLTSYITMTPPNTQWTNGDVVCKVDIPSGTFADDILFKFNSDDYQASNKRTFVGNGSVVVTIKDIYDNEYTSETLTIENIDKQAPTITVTPNISQNKATIEIGDDLSNVTKVTIKGTGYIAETTVKDYQTPTDSDRFTYDIKSKGSYVFTAYDAAGNKKEAPMNVEGSITDNEDLLRGLVKNRMTHRPSGWTNTDVELRIALTSEEELDDKPYKWDTKAYSKDKFIIVEENSTHTLVVKDMYGNEYESGDYVIDNIDKVKPTISSRFIDTDKNTFEITCQDALSGLLKVTMTDENGTELTIKDYLTTAPKTIQKFTYKVPKNGNYTFKAYDLAGNVEECDITAENAQITTELLKDTELVKYITQSPDDWTNGTVTLRLTLPSLEGLDAEPFKWNTSIYKSTSDVVVDGNGEYTITVKDEYGYEHQSANYEVSNIDRISPTVTPSVNENNNVITLDIIDEESVVYGASGLKLVTVTSVKNPTEITVKDYLESVTEDTVSYILSVDDTYTFHVYDRAGNVTNEMVTITDGKVDNEELTPEGLNAVMSHTPTAWTNKPVTLRVALISEAGLAEEPYKWAEEGEWSKARIATASVNGDYKVWVKDTFDNVIESEPYHIGNIDTENPTIEAELDENENTVTISLTDDLSGLSKVTVSDGSGIETTIKDYYSAEPLDDEFEWEVPYKATFTFKVYDNAGNWDYVQKQIINSITDNEDLTPERIAAYITHTPDTWTNRTITLQVNLPSFENLNPTAPFKWDDQPYSNSKTYAINEIGSYTLTIKDKYGNEITAKPHVVENVDHIFPNLNVELNNEQNTATITVSEDADSNGKSSGLDKVTVTNKDGESTIKNYIADTKSDVFTYTIPENDTYTFKVYDRAGNMTPFEPFEITNATTGSNVLTTEGLRAAIKQTPADGDFTNGNVELTLVLNGESGIADEPYRWNKNGNFTTNPSCTITKNGIYGFEVKDIYGNIISSSYEVRNIDKDNPKLSAKTVEGNRYFEIELDDGVLGSSLAKVTVEGDGIEGVNVIKDYGTDSIYSDKFRSLTPGYGTFNITAYDKAGNHASREVTIDEIYTLNSELTIENITDSIKSMNPDWTNGVVPLKLVLKSLDDLADAPYKWSDGVNETEYSTDNTFDVSENGSYYVTVMDKYGNEFTSNAFVVDNIDHVQPEFEYFLNDAHTAMTINVADSESGVSKIAWQGTAFNGLVSIKEYLEPVLSDSGIEVAIPTNGSYTIKVYDYAGNESSQEITINDIATENGVLTPLGVYSSMHSNPSNWTNEDVIVTVELPNKENVVNEGYYWDSSCVPGEGSITNEWTNYTSYVATTNGVIYLSVKDEFDTAQSIHESLPYSVENIDKVEPTLNIEVLGNGRVNINAVDEMMEGYGVSGIKEISVVDPNGQISTLKRNGGSVVMDSVEYIMYVSGSYLFRVTDHAGNITEDYVVVDENGVAVSNSWLAQGPDAITNMLNFTPTTWTKASVTVTLSPTDTTNFATKPYKFGDDDWQSENYVVLTENEEFTVKVRDVNGVIYESGKIIINNIDREAPSLDVNVQNINTSMSQVIASSTDKGSGVSMITIIGTEMPNETIIQKFDGGILTGSGSYHVTKNGHYRVRAYDMTGNYTESTVAVNGLIQVQNNATNNPSGFNNYDTYNNVAPSSGVKAATKSTTTTNAYSTTRSVEQNPVATSTVTNNTITTTESVNNTQGTVEPKEEKKSVLSTIKEKFSTLNTPKKVETTSETSTTTTDTTKTVKLTEKTKTSPLEINESSPSVEKDADVVTMNRNSQIAGNKEATQTTEITNNKTGVNILLAILVGLIVFTLIVLIVRYISKKKELKE